MVRYTVRQAAEMTGVKAYVLRYWEDELELYIQRNELGHRYYTGYDIQLFRNIKELKNRGLQLRAIKELIPRIARIAPGTPGSKILLLEGEVSQSLEEEKNQSETPLRGEVEENPQKQLHDAKILEFQAILERLIAQELKIENEEEERCRSLDLAIRRQQLARKEAAAASAEKKGRRRRKG